MEKLGQCPATRRCPAAGGRHRQLEGVGVAEEGGEGWEEEKVVVAAEANTMMVDGWCRASVRHLRAPSMATTSASKSSNKS